MSLRLIIVFSLFTVSVALAKVSATIEEWNTLITVKSQTNVVITEMKKIRILNEEGYKMAIYYSYYNSFRKIRNLKYTITDDSGRKIKKLGKSDALDIMYNPSYEIGDARMVILDPKYRSFPFIAVIEVEIEYDGFLDFPDWVPRYAPDLEVKEATMRFESPKGYKYRSVEVNGIAPPVKVFTEGVNRAVWRVNNLPAMRKHNNYNSFSTGQPKVLISPINFSFSKKEGSFQSWEDFGNWYLELNEGRNELSRETKEYLDDVVANNEDVRVVVKELYRHMQSKVRYISIQLGIGGYQAIPADEVEKDGYGDCKGLTNYMKAMLDYLKIPSNYILVGAGEDADDLISEFPSNQFNHVFLGVPFKSDTLLLECTSQILPPAYIGTFTDDRNVLWVTKGQSKIIRTPIYSAKDNLKLNQHQITINKQGDAEILLKTNQSGVFFDEVMAYKSLPADRIERFNYKKFDYKDYTIQSFDFEQPNFNEPSLDLYYGIKVAGLAQIASDKMIIPMNLFPSIEREFYLDPISKKGEVRRAFTLEDHVDIEIPENFWVDIIPEGSNILTNYGSYKTEVLHQEPNKIRIIRKVVIEKGLYEGESFSKFYDYIKKIRVAELEKIVLQSKT